MHWRLRGLVIKRKVCDASGQMRQGDVRQRSGGSQGGQRVNLYLLPKQKTAETSGGRLHASSTLLPLSPGSSHARTRNIPCISPNVLLATHPMKQNVMLSTYHCQGDIPSNCTNELHVESVSMAGHVPSTSLSSDRNEPMSAVCKLFASMLP